MRTMRLDERHTTHMIVQIMEDLNGPLNCKAGYGFIPSEEVDGLGCMPAMVISDIGVNVLSRDEIIALVEATDEQHAEFDRKAAESFGINTHELYKSSYTENRKDEPPMTFMLDLEQLNSQTGEEHYNLMYTPNHWGDNSVRIEELEEGFTYEDLAKKLNYIFNPVIETKAGYAETDVTAHKAGEWLAHIDRTLELEGMSMDDVLRRNAKWLLGLSEQVAKELELNDDTNDDRIEYEACSYTISAVDLLRHIVTDKRYKRYKRTKTEPLPYEPSEEWYHPTLTEAQYRAEFAGTVKMAFIELFRTPPKSDADYYSNYFPCKYFRQMMAA